MTPKKARRGARTGRPRPAAGGSGVPVTVLTGFLGSGKTTLLQSLLVQSWRSVPRVRVGVVVNDMSELDVDGVVVEETDVVGSGEGTLVTITGGPLHERIGALRAACESLLDRNDLDHLFIETSGSTRPRSLVTLLTRHPRLRLHGFLTMVDAAMLRDDLALGDAIAPRHSAQRAAGVPDLETLLVEQVRAASDIYLTKVDKLTDDQVRHVAQSLHRLNPGAGVHAVQHGNVRLATVRAHPPYDADQVRRPAPDPAGREQSPADAAPLTSLVLDDPRPFHPRRLWEAFTGALPQDLHRSKGFTWLPTRDDQVLLWNQASGGIDLQLLGYWKAGILAHPDNNLTAQERRGLAAAAATGDPVFADRRTQLTVIGPPGPTNAFFALLRTCLLTDEEVSTWQSGGSFEDPWPTRTLSRKAPGP